MSGKELFAAMSYVDERFVDEAENKTIPKHIDFPWVKAASLAACLCLILVSLYNLQPYFHHVPTEGIGQGAADAMPEGEMENNLKDESAAAAPASPAEEFGITAPEMMVRVQELTETGFIGTVQNNGGFTVFDDGTEITVTVDLETDSKFTPEKYEVGDLVYVMYTSWDKDARTIVASILGIVDEPICD